MYRTLPSTLSLPMAICNSAAFQVSIRGAVAAPLRISAAPMMMHTSLFIIRLSDSV